MFFFEKTHLLPLGLVGVSGFSSKKNILPHSSENRKKTYSHTAPKTTFGTSKTSKSDPEIAADLNFDLGAQTAHETLQAPAAHETQGARKALQAESAHRLLEPFKSAEHIGPFVRPGHRISTIILTRTVIPTIHQQTNALPIAIITTPSSSYVLST